MSKEVKITGEVVMFQTDENGKVVPGTYKRSKNTISSDLKNYLAFKIVDATSNKALDNLFTANGDITSAGTTNNGGDGIAHGSAGTKDVDYFFTTSKNAGGTGAENYVEFYGFIDGPATLNDTLKLGFNYNNTTYEFDTVFATYSINETVASGRKYHFYWKITIS